jgi:hypothetical protein
MHLDIETSNIPIMNLRREFEDYLRLFKTASFKDKLFNCRIEPVQIPNLTWHGHPNDLLTLMLQRAILGLESYLSAAAEYELSRREALSEELKEKLANPFSLSKKTVVALYERIPELVEPSLKLSTTSKDLYAAVAHFYKTVRNPIFHGNQVAFSGENFERVASAFDLLASVYDWIDSWYGAFPSGWKRTRNP